LIIENFRTRSSVVLRYVYFPRLVPRTFAQIHSQGWWYRQVCLSCFVPLFCHLLPVQSRTLKNVNVPKTSSAYFIVCDFFLSINLIALILYTIGLEKWGRWKEHLAEYEHACQLKPFFFHSAIDAFRDFPPTSKNSHRPICFIAITLDFAPR